MIFFVTTIELSTHDLIIKIATNRQNIFFSLLSRLLYKRLVTEHQLKRKNICLKYHLQMEQMSESYTLQLHSSEVLTINNYGFERNLYDQSILKCLRIIVVGIFI